MTVVSISGKRSSTKESLVKSLIMHTSKEFFGKKHVIINIEFVKLPDDFTASVNNLDFRSASPRTFVIKVDQSQSIMRTLVAIAHELVHVRQYVDGHLYTDVDSANHKWMGVDHEMGSSLKATAGYWRLPWEIEAHGLEKALVFEWMCANGYDEGQSWYEHPF